jgi:hypothetical protein
LIALSPAKSALLASGGFAECGLIEATFSSGIQRLAIWPIDVPSGGFTWSGTGDAIKIPQVKSAAESSGDRLTLEISCANLALMALCLGSSSTWRGRRVRILTQFMTPEFIPVEGPDVLWQGEMIRIGIRRDQNSDGIDIAVIEIEMAAVGTGRARTAEGLRWTPQQQRSKYPADAGLDGMPSMLEKTSWLSEAYQKWTA